MFYSPGAFASSWPGTSKAGIYFFHREVSLKWLSCVSLNYGSCYTTSPYPSVSPHFGTVISRNSLSRAAAQVFFHHLLDKSIWIAGADYSSTSHGYMDGAIRTGQAVAKLLVQKLRAS